MTPTSINKPWLDEDGNSITIQDCHEAMMLAKSLTLKELKFNKAVKESPQMKKDYERKFFILDLIEKKFFVMKMRTKKVKMRTVQKRGK